MPPTPKQVVVMGATGSIGQSALDVLDSNTPDSNSLNSDSESLQTYALTGHNRLDRLLAAAQRLKPRYAIATNPDIAKDFDWSELPTDTELLIGEDALLDVVTHQEVDIVLAAIVGRAGLEGTWSALKAGKRVALANKETLVMAGPLAMQLAKESGAEIIPVDSEHSAVFQAILAGRRDEISRVILTASGGPFRTFSTEQMRQVTVEQALNHPTWNMGPKITVDSATMMNKALEIIEARWLFDLDPDQISVVVQPSSMVHSLVEFHDGSVIAQMSPPDMRLPIQYALTYPKRLHSPTVRIDWTKGWSVDFEPADLERFPALELGIQVARRGGTAGAVLNAANEAAVARFLNGNLPFHKIVPACRAVLEQHTFDASPNLNDLIQIDQWARQEIITWDGS